MVIWMLLTWSRFQIGSNIEIGEARVDDVLHRLLAQVVVDAEDVFFREELCQQAAQCLRRLAVVAERLLDHQPRVRRRSPDLRQRLRHGAEQAGRHREVMQRPLRLAELLAQFGEGGGVVVVAIDVAQQVASAVACAFASVTPWCFRLSAARSFSWSRLQPALATPMIGTFKPSSRTRPEQRREDLLVGEIAGGAEKHDRVGRLAAIYDPALLAGFSTWPPNSKRIADSSWLA